MGIGSVINGNTNRSTQTNLTPTLSATACQRSATHLIPYIPDIKTTVGASSFSNPAMAYVTFSGFLVSVPGIVNDRCMREAQTYSMAKVLSESESVIVREGRKGGEDGCGECGL
jgi:hypothetical protein